MMDPTFGKNLEGYCRVIIENLSWDSPGPSEIIQEKTSLIPVGVSTQYLNQYIPNTGCRYLLDEGE
jgi:hypothetical protein